MADTDQIAEMRANYLNGNYGYGHAKNALFEVLWSKFSKQREVFNYYIQNETELEQKLQLGEAKAKIIAEETMNRVREVLGFN